MKEIKQEKIKCWLCDKFMGWDGQIDIAIRNKPLQIEIADCPLCSGNGELYILRVLTNPN